MSATVPLIEVEDLGDGKERVTYRFHPGQVRAWNSTKQVVAIIAGACSGMRQRRHRSGRSRAKQWSLTGYSPRTASFKQFTSRRKW